MKQNMAIRESAQRTGVRLWEVAYALGVEDSTFFRKLRRELPAQEQEKILRLVAEIAQLKQEEESK